MNAKEGGGVTSYWNNFNFISDKVNTELPPSAVENTPQKLDAGIANLKNMTSGEILHGEVVLVKGNEVLVRLADQTVISAQLSGNLQVSIGQSLFFEIQNGTEGQIALRALFTNLSQEAVLGQALSDAGLPINKESAEMVETLMREEMPIGKETLQTIYREVVDYSQLRPAEIVKMHKLGIEVNDANVQGFKAVLNCEERLAMTTKQLVSDLHNEINFLFTQDKTKEGYILGKELLSYVTQNCDISMLQDEMLFASPTEKEVFFDLIKDTLLQLPDVLPENLILDNDASDKMQIFQNDLVQNFFEHSVLGGNDENKVGLFLRLLLTEFENGNLPPEKLGQLFEKEVFKEVIGKGLSEAWLLKPFEVADKSNISDLYERIQEHIRGLSETVAQTIGSSSNLTQSMQQMQDNIDFLAQLGKMVPYVQLPLKLNGKSATGDLYVFADKKSLAQKDENITAALHLDMQYLGHLDVFVQLKSSGVETDFKVETDEILLFLEEHMDILQERLKKRGYNLSVKLEKTEEKQSLKDDIMNISKSNNEDMQQQPIAYYRLDVRA